ncbi:MAG: MBL fold metallo-hydrolase [Streptococcaceae bacterium]|jgi:mRNA degradation ribonuclease J1/J2|nr:MBL fold metallo-hydrolase [Streptococcaceae bacterium]
MVLKDKIEVIFHAGVLTIGGTIVEIAYHDSHIFFDFGTEFRPELKFPDESLKTLLDNHLIPELKDIYDFRFDYHYAGMKRPDFKHSAVFLSHAHLDHTKMINYLEPSIPLYALNATAEVLPVLNQNGDFLIEQPFEEDKSFTREIIGVAPYGKIRVGEIEVELAPVDHDAYGACGMIISAAGKKIAYTGDLRLHGYDPDDTLKFTALAKHADMLIMEGVSISFPERENASESAEYPINSEQDLIQAFIRLEAENPERQLTFNGYPANVKRFSQLVKASSRKVVLTQDMSLLLKKIFGQETFYYVIPGKSRPESLNPKFEVDYSELLADKSEYLWQVESDFDKLQKGGLYIHSDASPLGDFDPQYQVFLDMLSHNDIEFVRIACSGHATPDDLNKIVQLIEPKMLVPIHSYHPELLENPYGERILPVRGQIVEL